MTSLKLLPAAIVARVKEPEEFGISVLYHFTVDRLFKSIELTETKGDLKLSLNKTFLPSQMSSSLACENSVKFAACDDLGIRHGRRSSSEGLQTKKCFILKVFHLKEEGKEQNIAEFESILHCKMLICISQT